MTYVCPLDGTQFGPVPGPCPSCGHNPPYSIGEDGTRMTAYAPEANLTLDVDGKTARIPGATFHDPVTLRAYAALLNLAADRMGGSA